MKYRTKLYIALLSMSTISTIMAMWMIYHETRYQLITQIKSQVLSIAGTTAVLLDGRLLEEWVKQPEESSETYWKLKKDLIRVVQVNQRHVIHVRYVYLIKPNEKNPNELNYLIDSEIDPTLSNPLGEIEPIGEQLGLLEGDNLNQLFVPDEVITDLYGTWLSGFAPIRDEKGRYLATVGVDLDASDVFEAMQRLLRFESLAFLLSVVVGVIGAFFLSRQATNNLNQLCRTVSRIGAGDLSQRVSIKTRDEFNTLAEEINAMARGLQERDRMQKNFARYVSSHVMEQIVKSESALELGGERRKVTILFSDIRDFTSLSEQHSAEVVVSLLNEYFEKMIGIIFKYNGTLDKFLGDGLMVEFGAPLEDPLEEQHAVQAALEMQHELSIMRDKWVQEGRPTIHIGIGIHTGEAIVGTIGSPQRMEYTAIGDTVNAASRIQATTRSLDVDILISETTYAAVKELFTCKDLGPISLRGKTATMTLYQVLGEKNVEKDNN